MKFIYKFVQAFIFGFVFIMIYGALRYAIEGIGVDEEKVGIFALVVFIPAYMVFAYRMGWVTGKKPKKKI